MDSTRSTTSFRRRLAAPAFFATSALIASLLAVVTASPVQASATITIQDLEASGPRPEYSISGLARIASNAAEGTTVSLLLGHRQGNRCNGTAA